MRELDVHQLNTGPEVATVADAWLAAHRHLRLETADLEPAEVAAIALEWLEQP